MTVTLTGSTLTLDDVVAVARRDASVALEPSAVDRMQASRKVVDRVLARDEPVYGLTTGVAELKRVRVPPNEVERFNADLIHTHRVAQGPPAGDDVVRAALLRLLNGFAAGYPGVRPELAQVLVKALNNGAHPVVRSRGSVGQGDLGPNADIASELFAQLKLAAGEALALLNHNALSTGSAALAIWDARQLAASLAVAGALRRASPPTSAPSIRPWRRAGRTRAFKSPSRSSAPCLRGVTCGPRAPPATSRIR